MKQNGMGLACSPPGRKVVGSIPDLCVEHACSLCVLPPGSPVFQEQIYLK